MDGVDGVKILLHTRPGTPAISKNFQPPIFNLKLITTPSVATCTSSHTHHPTGTTIIISRTIPVATVFRVTDRVTSILVSFHFRDRTNFLASESLPSPTPEAESIESLLRTSRQLQSTTKPRSHQPRSPRHCGLCDRRGGSTTPIA